MKRLRAKEVEFLQLVQLEIDGQLATAFIVKKCRALGLIRKVFGSRIAWDTWKSTTLPTTIDLAQVDLPGDRIEEREEPRSDAQEGIIIIVGEHFHYDGKRDGEHFIMGDDDSPTIKAVESLNLNNGQLDSDTPKGLRRGVVRIKRIERSK